jgi:Tfp pilus assembly protein PilZ
MNTISVGGLSFKTDEMLDKGGIVTMMIESPDGQEKIQVQGHIVWNEENRAYGVQFDQAKDSIASHIQSWTRNLVKAN